ncbi:MAG: tRNA (guanosine(37)-N1)-methyltransferase TrmD [Desulfohalobiaceae bacterium]|nr:tRNA (guanosine(37)-N1)-methyltransferase TrmD [Desulfohalobiaceae bacterium]
MKFNLLTLFPEFFSGPLSCGLMGKAIARGLLACSLVNPRDFARDRHRSVDDRPFGGGPGMVLSLDPLLQALAGIEHPGRILLLSPEGRLFDQDLARELAEESELTLVCGRYEGIDARFQECVPAETVSMGNYVLNGGESGALCLMEAVSRLQVSFMGCEDSATDESFSAGLLDYPHYTRPAEYHGHRVPDILLSGDHREIAAWRRKQALCKTLLQRPDLLEEGCLSPEDLHFLRGVTRFRPGKNLYLGLVHYPVLNKKNEITAVSLTNFDIHDIARVCCSYGLGGFFVITPLADQQELAKSLIRYWKKGAGGHSNPDRVQALNCVDIAADLDQAVQAVRERSGVRPRLIATSAKTRGRTRYQDLRQALQDEAVLLLLGTGHGLADQVLERVDGVLPPLRALSAYNHLSVRTAAAVIVDRIIGESS